MPAKDVLGRDEIRAIGQQMSTKVVKPIERVILALKPEAKRYRVKVEGVAGLFVDVWPSGTRSYQVRYCYRDKDRSKNLGRVDVVRLGVAIDNAKRLIAGIEIDKRDLVAERQDAKALGTIDQLFQFRFDEHAIHKKSGQQDKDIYRLHIKDRLGDKLVADVKRSDLRDALEDISKKVSSTQARLARAIISAMFNWAEDRDMLSSLARGIKLSGKPPAPRKRIYTEDELKRFWHALNALPRADDTARALKLILLTAKRLSEVVKAKKADLQLTGSDPRWIWPDTKNDKGDDVPLTATTAALFAEQILAAGDSEYVFPARTGATRYPYADPKAVSRMRKRILDTLGIKGATTHDLRRTVSVETRRLGIREDVRQKLLNHAPARGDVTARHYTPYDLWRERRGALEAFEERLREIVGAPLIT
jgi:integrase